MNDEAGPLRHPDGSPVTVVDALVASGLAKSKGEARRLIVQGGVSVVTGDDETMEALLQSVTVTGKIAVRGQGT